MIPGSKPRATLVESHRARSSPMVRAAWAMALRAGVPLSELKESSILHDERGEVPELDDVEAEEAPTSGIKLNANGTVPVRAKGSR